MLAFYILGVVLSITMNLLVVVVLAMGRKQRKPSDFPMISLAIADILRASVGYPLEIYAALNKTEINKLSCIVSGFSITFLGLVAISHLVSMSIEKCIRLNLPYVAEKWFSSLWVSFCTILACWFYGLVWALFPLIGWSSYEREQGAKYRCSINMQSKDDTTKAYAYALLASCFVLPVIIMFVSAVLTLRKIKKIRVEVSNIPTDVEVGGSSTRRDEVRQSIMILVVIIAFLVAWSPYGICVFIMAVKGKIGQSILRFSAILAKSSTLYNPVIYIVFMKDFRDRCMMLLGCGTVPSDSSSSPNSMNGSNNSSTPNSDGYME